MKNPNENLTIVKGATLTPPIIGRITMGHAKPRDDGSALPQKDDHFTITTLVQNSDRSWPEHPLHKQHLGEKRKLESIPVRIAYNSLRLNLTNHFCIFGTSGAELGRTLCSGDGEKARRMTSEGVKTIDCPRPEACEYGTRLRCKSFTRAYFQLEGQNDPMGVFILRTTGDHTRNYLSEKLAQLHGWTEGKLAGMPLMLNIKVKSTSRSMRRPFWYADLDLRPDMDLFKTISEMKDYQKKLSDAGINQECMEEALLAGLGNSDFTDEVEDMDEWFSDSDLVQAATQNLQKTGLRGLDILKQAIQPAAEVSKGEAGLADEAPAAAGEADLKAAA